MHDLIHATNTPMPVILSNFVACTYYLQEEVFPKNYGVAIGPAAGRPFPML